ncbi:MULTISPECIES: mannose-6-phosphate isomerase, class I [Arthrobacter]|uniref:mannose-6-phosphate isomerase n=2 Tax=Arthrobacter TaxID=1663 RepID=A0ABU9KMH8_9MICC|nr:mannose-6-phosphate isomerase, class I [Arthrobacter sp. YJM1]MDP5227371.1 mannose-6-phosphate isomerase, class I [Arthrobacter sp. YJM1]
MFRLDNELRPYAWGSPTAIAGLLGRTPSGGPEAELWLGAHPDSPSRLDDGARLDELIAQDPVHFLGQESVDRFGARLPFLMKVLAAAEPLSLQVHPSLEQAGAGFARDEAAGVPRGSATRNYKDENHKPEMILALTPFRALCGFRPLAEAAELFRLLAERLGTTAGREFADRVSRLLSGEGGQLREAFRAIMDGDGGQPEAGEGLAVVVSGMEAGEGWHAPLAAAAALHAKYPGDPGVLVSLLLNLVDLEPGQAVYLPAGNVHAYLEGLGIEVMASSDNVLRGGLTPKHVDVPELLATVDFRPLPVPFLQAAESELGERVFTPPFEEFSVQELLLSGAPASDASHDGTVSVHQRGAAIILVTDGSLRLDGPQGEMILERGQSAFLPDADAPVNAHPHGPEGARAFVATTGLGTGKSTRSTTVEA